jgi:serine O-acetyltransferase
MPPSAPRDFMRARRAEHPPFVQAVIADAQVAAARRGERSEFGSTLDAVFQALRLAWQSDAFGALMCYRAKARLQSCGVPILPRLAHRLAMALAQVCIGDPVLVRAGVYLPHGQVVIDGLTEVGNGAVIRPFVTIGLKEGNLVGPTIGPDVAVGTGAKIFGPVTLGRGCRVGANAVVVDDVPEGCTVVGIPAAPINEARQSHR